MLEVPVGTSLHHHPIELGDAQRAIRLVRAHATEYGIMPDRLGVMGFSAGGHLAATMGTHFDNGSAADPDPIQLASRQPARFSGLRLSRDFVHHPLYAPGIAT